MSTLYAILPCYNEQENIAELTRLWAKERERLKNEGFDEVIVPIDDKSSDNTKEIISSLGEKYDNVRPIFHESNKGLGGAVRTGFEYFLRHGTSGDVCVIMDGDNTQKPKFVHRMTGALKISGLPVDCVIASRYKHQSKSSGIPALRNLLSYGARLYYSLILGVPHVKDYTCGYRMYSYDIIKKAFAKYGSDFPKERGFVCMMEILYKLHICGARFTEIPFDLKYDDKQGTSKMRVLKTVRESLLKTLEFKFSCKKTKPGKTA